MNLKIPFVSIHSILCHFLHRNFQKWRHRNKEESFGWMMWSCFERLLLQLPLLYCQQTIFPPPSLLRDFFPSIYYYSFSTLFLRGWIFFFYIFSTFIFLFLAAWQKVRKTPESSLLQLFHRNKRTKKNGTGRM